MKNNSNSLYCFGCHLNSPDQQLKKRLLMVGIEAFFREYMALWESFITPNGIILLRLYMYYL